MKNTSRRTFLKYAATASAGMYLIPSTMMKAKSQIGIQLYTVRDMMDKDVKGTLSMLSKIGYKLVEGAGYKDGAFYGMSARDFKSVLKENGLKMPSGHYSTGLSMPDAVGTMSNGWEQAVQDAKEVGQSYMVCAYLSETERTSLKDYQDIAKLMNKCGQQCKDAGIQFAYHNHNFEFQEMDGKLPYNILLQETDPDLVKFEMDIYWVTKAGHDPVELFKSAPGRFPLWHVKDMDKNGDFAAVGTGTIDFKKVFAAKDISGMKLFFVEQDKINGDVKDTITTSYTNLEKLI